MSNPTEQAPRGPADPGRRNFLKLPLAAGAAGGLAGLAYLGRTEPEKQPQAAPPRKAVIDEYDDRNIKLAHRVPPGIGDDELLFLKQIGLRWARVEFQPAEATLDNMARVQERFAKQGVKIFSAVNYVHRSLKIQLGQKGRDDEIEQYQAFLRDLGQLRIPVADYD